LKGFEELEEISGGLVDFEKTEKLEAFNIEGTL